MRSSLSILAVPTCFCSNFLVISDENKTTKFTADDIIFMVKILHKNRIHLIYTCILSISFSLIFSFNLQMSSKIHNYCCSESFLLTNKKNKYN